MSLRVLLVDDTDHVRAMLAHVMGLQGFEVAGEAASGAEAIERAGELAPDIVVLDYKMPGMNGIETTRALREDLPDTPVVLYSAYVDEELRSEAESAGVNACVPKVAGIEALGRELGAIALRLGERSR